MRKEIKQYSAFTLMELAVIVMLMGLVSSLYVRIQRTENQQTGCAAMTRVQLNTLRQAVDRFARANDRFPLPAHRNVGFDDSGFGRETHSSLEVVHGSHGNALFGALPATTLGLPASAAIDCWGNKITYVVTEKLTNKATFSNSTTGALSVINVAGEPVNNEIGYAIISHGEDGTGAVKANYAGNRTGWCHLSALKRAKTENCEISNTTLISGLYNDGRDAGSYYFDDIVVQRGKPWSGMIDGKCSTSAAATCEIGTPVAINLGACGTFDRWQCSGIDGGATVDCSRVAPLCKVEGVCGAATGQSFASAPKNGLCANGASSEVIAMGEEFHWTCVGSFGGNSATCSALKNNGDTCKLPWGGTIRDGEEISAYRSATHSNCRTISETRTCAHGKLTGSFRFGKCSRSKRCQLPWGGSIREGEIVDAFATPTSKNCNALREPRQCINGSLTGNFNEPDCINIVGSVEDSSKSTQPTTEKPAAPAPAPAPVSCSFSGVVNWGAGCSASYSGGVSEGGSASANNTAPGYSGSISYTCSSGSWVLSSSSCTSTTF